MTFNEFEIGTIFYTVTGPWLVIDVATARVIAVKLKDNEVSTLRALWYIHKDGQRVVNYFYDDTREEVVFAWYDFEGCKVYPFSEEK